MAGKAQWELINMNDYSLSGAIHHTRALDLGHLNGMQPLFILLVTKGNFPAMTCQIVWSEIALWLLTVYSEDDHIHTHVPLLMDCVVFMENGTVGL